MTCVMPRCKYSAPLVVLVVVAVSIGALTLGIESVSQTSLGLVDGSEPESPGPMGSLSPLALGT